MERVDFEQWKPKEVARLLALVESGRRYYQNLVAALPVPLIVVAPDRSVVFANRAFRQAFGLRAEDLGRMSIDQILPSERLIEKIRDVQLHGIAQPGFSLEAGEKLLRIAIVPIRSLDEETEFETLLMIEEASPAAPGNALPAAPPQQIEQRQLTAARNAALQGLSARLAHDLNNPLMIVTGYAEELLLGLRKDDPQRSNAEQILEATQRIAALTAQLLQFTRKQANPPQPVELSAILAGFKAGEAAVNVLAGKPVWALADAAQLHEILLALVRAACEGSAEPRAAMACDTVLRPSARARITVSGNGRGLDVDQRAAVFEAFLAKDPEKSAGPALARAYSIVREWGGDLAVSSEPSGGSVFTVYLTPAQPQAAASAPERVRETVLVVDDEANIRGLIARILRREGYHVLQAGSAQEAFAVASTHEGPIHLLVTDVVLPGESGRQIAERMRQTLPSLKVLYISGFSGDESVRTGNFPPGSKYLQKPFALGALIAKVREALES
jgi:two-component system cell cycle sensor histidine kinase/response regulator CckA